MRVVLIWLDIGLFIRIRGFDVFFVICRLIFGVRSVRRVFMLSVLGSIIFGDIRRYVCLVYNEMFIVKYR